MSAPFSINQSTVSLFGVDLEVHQLNTGERVIAEHSMVALFEAMGSPDAALMDQTAMAEAIKGLFA